MGIQRVTGVTRGTEGYKGLQGVTRGFKGLKGVTGAYSGLQMNFFLTITSPEAFSWLFCITVRVE